MPSARSRSVEFTNEPLPDLEDSEEQSKSVGPKKFSWTLRDRRPHTPNRRAATSSPMVISSHMSSLEISQILTNHSCADVTGQLDMERCSALPIRGGGFGDVYEGALLDGRRVAIKCARLFVSSNEGLSKTTKALARELYSWSKCKHENILELYGLASYHGQIATVSPWMANGALPYYISQLPSPNRVAAVRKLCYEVACAVSYLHEIGLVHGDIKGANVLVADDGTAKLADFGNTRMQNYSLQFTGVFDSSVSVRWTAPELLNGDSDITPESDVYALAMTVLEAITGDVPFQGKGETTVLVDVMVRGKTPVRSEKHFPSENDSLWERLQECWRSTPSDRPAAKVVCCDLKSFLLVPDLLDV